jgi:FlaA1/EpsC-like NDP-sugar epimerase
MLRAAALVNSLGKDVKQTLARGDYMRAYRLGVLELLELLRRSLRDVSASTLQFDQAQALLRDLPTLRKRNNLMKGNEGQCALVTGASGGIGLELARVFAANRFDLVLLARSRDKLEDLARELKAEHGTKVTIVPADLSEPDAPRAVFDTLRNGGVKVDVLVNNAGLLFEGRFSELNLDDELRLLQAHNLQQS